MHAPRSVCAGASATLHRPHCSLSLSSPAPTLSLAPPLSHPLSPVSHRLRGLKPSRPVPSHTTPLPLKVEQGGRHRHRLNFNCKKALGHGARGRQPCVLPGASAAALNPLHAPSFHTFWLCACLMNTAVLKPSQQTRACAPLETATNMRVDRCVLRSQPGLCLLLTRHTGSII
jgi:hypothetical protein